MASLIDERVSDEVEALEAILMDDVVISKVDGIPESIEYVIHPSTGEKADQQFVCVTLEVKLIQDYPDKSPEVKLKNPRGLDDHTFNRISVQVNDKLNDCIGQPVVFELIELIRENLTESNLPSGQCVICLYNFTPGDVFIKTECYHHFHSHCLACHLEAGERNYSEELDKLPLWQKHQAPAYQPTCPVCRSPVICDIESLRKAPPAIESVTAPPFSLTSELKALQRKMATLLAHQTAKGGTVESVVSPPPLTLTTAADIHNESNPSTNSPSCSQENGVKAESPTTKNNQTPLSPKNDVNRSGKHYRGFNRRGPPGRKPNYGGSKGRNAPPPCASSTR